MTDYDVVGSRLSSKTKAYDRSKSSENLDMEQFHHFGTVFVKEDRETRK